MTHRGLTQPISMIAEPRRSSEIKPGNTIWEGPLAGNAPSFFAAGAGISSIRGRHWVLGAKGPDGSMQGRNQVLSALGPRLMVGSGSSAQRVLSALVRSIQGRHWVLGSWKGPVGTRFVD